MIAVWMVYCVAIGLAFVVVGYALERGLQYAGRATRWAWVVALVGSYVVPVAAWLRPEAFATFAAPIPVTIGSPSNAAAATTSSPSTIVHQPPSRFSLSDLDTPLAWAWVVASVILVVTLATAATRLVALRRRWRETAVDGRFVLVSRNSGPAVVGIWSPRVVLPEWALTLSAAERELMLAHEEQHVRAGDPALLAAAFVAVLIAPWNPALWWQWRRLRLAVEIDCDARVLAAGRSADAYGELLLHVGRRRTTQLLGAAAFGEPVLFLESRIRRILGALPRWRWAGVVLATVVATGAIVGACETPRPLAPRRWVADEQLRILDSVAPELLRKIDSVSPVLLRRLDSVMAARQQPWVRENLQRLFPALLGQQSGPPIDVILVHDARLQVSMAWMGTRTHDQIGAADIQQHFKGFTPGNDGWGMVDRRALQGIVRDNVRVIWVHHEPKSRDLSALQEHPEMVQLPWIRQSIIKYYPRLLTERSGPPVHLWFIADPRKQVLRTVQRPGGDSIRVGIPEIRAVFPELAESKINSWSITNRRTLRGFVRDNVYVVWIQLREGASLP
jgi:beta-lactamase regulating signal transducer with metallopeptidase domain